MNPKKRNSSLDFIRTIAIILVVFNHAVESSPSYMSETFTHLRFWQGLFFVGRNGVPMFFYLTGYLMLSRDYSYNDGTISKFYKNNFFPMLFTWELWILILDVFLSLFNNKPFNWRTYVYNALFLKKVDLGMAWYMGVIIGIYLFIPYIAMILHKMNEKAIGILLLISYIYTFVVPTLNLWLSLSGDDNLSIKNQLDLDFGGKEFGFYIVLGYCCYRWKDRVNSILKSEIKRIILILIAGLSTIFSIDYLSGLRLHGKNYMLWYDFATIPVTSFIIFALIVSREIHSQHINHINYIISTSSFGIYLLHRPIQLIVDRYFHIASYEIINTIMLWIISFTGSLIIVNVIGMLPKVGRMLFLKK